MIISFRENPVLNSLLFLILISSVSAQVQKLQEEKELEVVNFENIKKVLEDDGLSKAAEEKQKEVTLLKQKQDDLLKQKYNYPNEDELWGIISEIWLIKNAQALGWDFEKPDFGLQTTFGSTLGRLGFLQKKFKILIINTPALIRAVLPGKEGEMIFLVSLPFIRSLDLSKHEISLLLLEDYFRFEAGYFKNQVRSEKFKSLAGGNFYGNNPDQSMIEEMLKNYHKQIYEKGYSFQQQFEITKKMDTFLKSQPQIWNSYYQILLKLQNFLKVNLQYKDYVKLYPSPEMQLKWLMPEEKVL
jgi:hypothetical protein